MAGWSNVSEKLGCQLITLAVYNTPSTTRPTWNCTSSMEKATGQARGEGKKKTPTQTTKKNPKPQNPVLSSSLFVSYRVLEAQSEVNPCHWLKAEQEGLNHYHVFKCWRRLVCDPWKITTGATPAQFQQPLQLEGLVPVLATSLSTGKAPAKLAVKHLNWNEYGGFGSLSLTPCDLLHHIPSQIWHNWRCFYRKRASRRQRKRRPVQQRLISLEQQLRNSFGSFLQVTFFLPRF